MVHKAIVNPNKLFNKNHLGLTEGLLKNAATNVSARLGMKNTKETPNCGTCAPNCVPNTLGLTNNLHIILCRVLEHVLHHNNVSKQI